MRVRAGLLEFYALMALFAASAAVFLATIGQDALAERHPFQFFADSNTYHQIYAGDMVSFDGALVGVAANYVGPLLVLEALRGNVYLVMLLNTLVFAWSVQRIARLLGIEPMKLALLLMVSPLTVSSLLSVNKEIFAFPFIALALTGYMRRSVSAVILAFAASILVRWQLTGFYVLMLLLSGPARIFSRRTVLIGLLLGASAFYSLTQSYLEPVVAFVEVSIENYEEAGSGLFEAVLEYQKQGWYFLAFPVKAAHLLFGMGLKVDKMLSPVNIYNDLFVALHCAVTLGVFVMIVRRRRLYLRSDLVFASAVFLAVFCLTPVFAPRYLHPVFVLWVLVLAGAPALLPRRALRRSRASTKFGGPELREASS